MVVVPDAEFMSETAERVFFSSAVGNMGNARRRRRRTC